jgi:hypothetical protein
MYSDCFCLSIDYIQFVMWNNTALSLQDSALNHHVSVSCKVFFQVTTEGAWNTQHDKRSKLDLRNAHFSSVLSQSFIKLLAI